MTRIEDLSRSLVVLEQNSTVIAVVEMSASSWLVGGLVPGIARRPMKKLTPDPEALLQLLQRWREEAQRVGRAIGRMVLAYEIGRDGFWLARWLRERGVEAYAIHPASVAVSQEHKRAKTDRLDVELLQRVFLGWLRGERDHCSMAAIPTLEEEDARRPGRERELLVGEQTRLINRMKSAMARLGIRGFKPQLRKAAERLAGLRTPEGVPLPPHTLDEIRRDQERLALVRAQIKAIEQAREQRLQQAPAQDWNAMILFLARVVGLGIDTADTLVQEVFRRAFRDQRAVASYVGITGSPRQSGSKRREKGLTRSGNARVRRALIQLTWRFLLFQKGCALVQWYQARVAAKGVRKSTMIVALARKLLVALWRMVTTGAVPAGLKLRPAA
jgi:transposase